MRARSAELPRPAGDARRACATRPISCRQVGGSGADRGGWRRCRSRRSSSRASSAKVRDRLLGLGPTGSTAAACAAAGADPRLAAAAARTRGRLRRAGAGGARARAADRIWRGCGARLASLLAGVRRRDRRLAAGRRRRCGSAARRGDKWERFTLPAVPRSIYRCAARRGPNGSTASFRSGRCAIR